MNEKFTIQHLKHMKDRSDWKKVKSLTEREIMAAAKADPDAQPMTKAALKRAKRVHHKEEIKVKSIRRKVHWTQDELAHCLGISKRTVQDWEEEKRQPTPLAKNFLKVIANEPRAVRRALSH